MMGERVKQRVLMCTCEHAYQDQKYGKYKRLHNISQKESATPKGFRCTVCARVRPGT